MALHIDGRPAGRAYLTTATVRNLLVSTVLTAVMLTATAVVAQEVPAGRLELAQASETQTFSIPSQPLASALDRFSEQTGVSFAYTTRQLEGVRSPGAAGTFQPGQALAQLLAGTGLNFRFTAPDTVTLFGAQTDEDEGPIEVGPVLVEGSAVRQTARGSDVDPLMAYETPGSVSVITRERVERFRGISPADFLRDTPGVLSGESRGGGAIDVNIRGLQSFDRTPVRIDGARQSSSSTRGYMGETTRTFIDPDMIGGVVINKGPSSNLQAAGAVGGLVEIRTLEPDDIITDGKDWGVRLRVGAITNTTAPPPTGTPGGVEIGANFVAFTTEVDPRLQAAFGIGPETVDFDPDLLGAERGGPERFDRPGVLEPTDGHVSLAVARRFDKLAVVGAYTHREIGNYFAGERGGFDPFIEGSSEELCEEAALYAQLFPGFGFDSGDPLVCITREAYRVSAGQGEYRRGEEVLNTSNDSQSWLAKVEYEFAPGHHLQLGYQRYEADFGFIFPSNLNQSSLNEQQELTRTEIDTLTARYRFDPLDNDLIDLELNVWHTSQFFDEESLAAYDSYIIFETRNTERFGVELENMARFGNFSLGLGAAFSVLDGDFNMFSEISGVEFIAIEDIARREEYAFTANAEWTPNDWLTVATGFQQVGYEQPATLQPFGIYEIEGEINSTDGAWVPSTSLVIEPVEGLQLFASYAEAVRLPSETELQRNRSFQRSSSAGPLEPFPEVPGFGPIRPEHSHNIEIGGNWLRRGLFGVNDALGTKLVYFNNRIDDYLARLQVQLDPDLPFPTPVLVNLDYARFEGAEFSSYYEHDRFFADLNATYYFDVRFCRLEETEVGQFGSAVPSPICRSSGAGERDYAKNHVPPEFAANLSLGARFFDRRLMLGTRVRYIGERFGDNLRARIDRQTGEILEPSPEGGLRANLWESNTLVDLFGSYEFNDTVVLDLTVDNLTDRFYLDPLNLSNIPSPGRMVRANLTMQF